MRKVISVIALAAAVIVPLGVIGIPAASAAPNATVCTFSGNAALNSGFPATGGAGALDGTISCTGTVSVSGTLHADFTYNEPQATCPAAGTAAGVFSVNGGAITGDFSWTRVGGTAAIVISNVNGGGFSNGSGAAVAAFTPDNLAGAATCSQTTLATLGAAVTGTATIADAT